jgi:hypothetical protein
MHGICLLSRCMQWMVNVLDNRSTEYCHRPTNNTQGYSRNHFFMYWIPINFIQAIFLSTEFLDTPSNIQASKIMSLLIMYSDYRGGISLFTKVC